MKILHVNSINQLDPEKSFYEWGMDSLTALDLKDSLEKYLKIPLSSTVMLDYPTLDRLLGHVLEENSTAPAEKVVTTSPIGEDHSPRASVTPKEVQEETMEGIPDQKELEQLSEEELVALLAQELSED